jgi:hypothetical protein
MPLQLQQLPIGTPEQTSPFNNLLSNALKSYQQQVHARYAPQQQQADIFSKEIGPLAALASNPNFTGFNPQVQKMIASRIGNYLNGNQGAQAMEAEGATPGYPRGEDIYKRISESNKITEAPGGRGNVIRSSLSNIISKIVGNNPVSEALGGGNAADAEAHGAQAEADAVQYLKLKSYSPSEIKEILRKRPGESLESRLKRLKPYFKNESEQSSPSTSDREMDMNINEEAHRIGIAPSKITKAAEYFNVAPEKIIAGLDAGITNDEDMADYVKGEK